MSSEATAPFQTPSPTNRKSGINMSHKTQSPSISIPAHTASSALTLQAASKAKKRAAFELLVKKAIPGKAKAGPLRNFKNELAKKVDKQ
jgi:hypothetical protein